MVKTLRASAIKSTDFVLQNIRASPATMKGEASTPTGRGASGMSDVYFGNLRYNDGVKGSMLQDFNVVCPELFAGTSTPALNMSDKWGPGNAYIPQEWDPKGKAPVLHLTLSPKLNEEHAALLSSMVSLAEKAAEQFALFHKIPRAQVALAPTARESKWNSSKSNEERLTTHLMVNLEPETCLRFDGSKAPPKPLVEFEEKDPSAIVPPRSKVRVMALKLGYCVFRRIGEASSSNNFLYTCKMGWKATFVNVIKAVPWTPSVPAVKEEPAEVSARLKAQEAAARIRLVTELAALCASTEGEAATPPPHPARLEGSQPPGAPVKKQQPRSRKRKAPAVEVPAGESQIPEEDEIAMSSSQPLAEPAQPSSQRPRKQAKKAAAAGSAGAASYDIPDLWDL
jgi:hypothetical protein